MQVDHAVVQANPPGIVQPHQPHDVLDLERRLQERVPHVPPDGKMQLRLLQMQPRRRKQVQIADMVVVQMRQHQVGHHVRVDVEQRQHLGRRLQQRAPAPGGDLGVEPAIDDHDPAIAADHPDVIGHRPSARHAGRRR